MWGKLDASAVAAGALYSEAVAFGVVPLSYVSQPFLNLSESPAFTSCILNGFYYLLDLD